jgi:hypothetical protein
MHACLHVCIANVFKVKCCLSLENEKIMTELTIHVFEELLARGRDGIAALVTNKEDVGWLIEELEAIVQSGKLPEEGVTFGMTRLVFAARDGNAPQFYSPAADEVREMKVKAKISALTKKARSVPAAAFKNKQIDLFQDFLANTVQERNALSNAIDLWDSVPRYSLSRPKQEKLRLEGGFLPLAEVDFQYRGQHYTAQIRPARIEIKDKEGDPTGQTIEFYPSAREELVEHALRKLATEQQAGFLDATDSRSGVMFTLYQLRGELAARGHAMKYVDLVESLDIMNMSVIRLIDNGTNKKDPSLVSQTYLPTLVKVNKEGLASDPNAKWLVQFHSSLTESITQSTYRQFNYQRLMSCQSQLSRWLISQLVLKYTFAAPGNTFRMLYSTIKRDSGLLENYSRPRASVDALDEAFEELKREGVLMRVKKDATTGARGKIEDVSYTLATSVKFASEQRAANKRQSTDSAALGLVDNSQ